MLLTHSSRRVISTPSFDPLCHMKEWFLNCWPFHIWFAFRTLSKRKWKHKKFPPNFFLVSHKSYISKPRFRPAYYHGDDGRSAVVTEWISANFTFFWRRILGEYHWNVIKLFYPSLQHDVKTTTLGLSRLNLLIYFSHPF